MKIHALTIFASSVTMFAQGTLAHRDGYNRTPPSCDEAKARHEKRSADVEELIDFLGTVGNDMADTMASRMAAMKEAMSPMAEAMIARICGDENRKLRGFGRDGQRGFGGGGPLGVLGGDDGEGPEFKPWEPDDYCDATQILSALEGSDFVDGDGNIENRVVKKMMKGLSFRTDMYESFHPEFEEVSCLTN